MKEYLLQDDDFLVSQTDARGIIMFANDDFCKIAGYGIDELVGQNHNIVRHNDMPKVAFKGLWDVVRNDEVWSGYVKNRTKDNGFYWVYATVYPKYDPETNEKYYISCRRKPSSQEIQDAQSLYQTLH